MGNKILVIAGFVYVILYILFYPPFYTTSDEQSYLLTAYLLQEGKLTIDDHLYSYGFVFNGENYVSRYPVGYSFILFPFTFLGFNASFLTGLIIHLLGGAVFYKILKKTEVDTKYVLLYLFFPTLVWYSPTLTNEKAVLLFFLLGFYYYISKREKDGFLSGLSFGLAFLVRNTSIIGFLPFVFISFFRDRRQFFHMTLGFLPFLIGVMAYNTVFFGGPLITGYAVSSQAVVPQVLSFTPYNIIYSSLNIIIALIILYPLMFFAPFLYRGKGRLEIILLTLSYILFYSSSVNLYGGFKPVDIIAGMRHFVPIIPFYIIAYIPLYKKMVSALRLPKGVYPIFIAMLVVISVLFFNLQYNLLDVQKQVSDDIYANTEDGALIIGDLMTSKYLLGPLGDRRFLEARAENMSLYINDKTYIVHRHYIEGRVGYETESDMILEKIIGGYPTAQIYTRDYAVNLPYATSRAFTLDIYKVGE